MTSTPNREQVKTFLFSFNYMQSPWRPETKQAKLEGSMDRSAPRLSEEEPRPSKRAVRS